MHGHLPTYGLRSREPVGHTRARCLDDQRTLTINHASSNAGDQHLSVPAVLALIPHGVICAEMGDLPGVTGMHCGVAAVRSGKIWALSRTDGGFTVLASRSPAGFYADAAACSRT